MGVMGVMGNQRGKKENYMETGLIQFFFHRVKCKDYGSIKYLMGFCKQTSTQCW